MTRPDSDGAQNIATTIIPEGMSWATFCKLPAADLRAILARADPTAPHLTRKPEVLRALLALIHAGHDEARARQIAADAADHARKWAEWRAENALARAQVNAIFDRPPLRIGT